MLLPVTGPDYEDDEPEQLRPVPHQDDRLWRHPSEMAALHAAHANAETAQVPVVQIAEERSRLQTGLLVAAGVVVVGAVALTLGVVSSRWSSSASQLAGDASRIQPIARTIDPGSTQTLVNALAPDTVVGITDPRPVAYNAAEAALAEQVHSEVASSLPRVQAATPSGMREGSGLFVTDEGHVATSAGLIRNADYVLVWTEDGQRWRAQVVASDPVSDVAVIQIDSTDWPGVALSTGADLSSGHHAHSLDHDLDRVQLGEVVSIEGAIVGVDSPTALPGSAIIDDRGSVIAMVNNDGSNRHATPAWMLEQVAVDLISAGTTTHIWLGIVVEGTTESDSRVVLVNDVVANSPAQLAGLRPNDVIDSLNGEAVGDSATLHRLVQTLEPGDEAVLTVTRNDSRRIIIAVLSALPE